MGCNSVEELYEIRALDIECVPVVELNRGNKIEGLAEPAFSRVKAVNLLPSHLQRIADCNLLTYNVSVYISQLIMLGAPLGVLCILTYLDYEYNYCNRNDMEEFCGIIRFYQESGVTGMTSISRMWLRQYKSIYGFRAAIPPNVLPDLLSSRNEDYNIITCSARDSGKVTLAAFNNLFLYHCAVLVDEINLASAIYIEQEFESFIEKAPLWVTSGASSNKALGKTKRMGLLQNPNWVIEKEIPIRMTVKGSIKKEPGDKNRLILAEDDLSYLHTAFYLGGFEPALNIEGAVMRQQPYDVFEWLTTCKGIKPSNVIFCADFKDFNAQHSTWCRSMLHTLISLKMIRLGYINKGKAGLALVKRINNTTVQNDKSRVIFGLNSGERATTCDNTLLHRIYSRMASDISGTSPLFMRACGDDEISVFSTQREADKYYRGLLFLGFKLQHYKQLLSRNEGEFLQLNIVNKDIIKQPIITPVIRASHPFVNSVHGRRWFVIEDIINDHFCRFIRCGMALPELTYFVSLYVGLLKDGRTSDYKMLGNEIISIPNPDYEEVKINYRCNLWGPMINKKVNTAVASIKYNKIKNPIIVTKEEAIENLYKRFAGAKFSDGMLIFKDDMFDNQRIKKHRTLNEVLTNIGAPITVSDRGELLLLYNELKISERSKIDWVADRVTFKDIHFKFKEYKELLPGQLVAALK